MYFFQREGRYPQWGTMTRSTGRKEPLHRSPMERDLTVLYLTWPPLGFFCCLQAVLCILNISLFLSSSAVIRYLCDGETVTRTGSCAWERLLRTESCWIWGGQSKLCFLSRVLYNQVFLFPSKVFPYACRKVTGHNGLLRHMTCVRLSWVALRNYRIRIYMKQQGRNWCFIKFWNGLGCGTSLSSRLLHINRLG